MAGELSLGGILVVSRSIDLEKYHYYELVCWNYSYLLACQGYENLKAVKKLCAAHLDLLVTKLKLWSSSDGRGIRRWQPLLPCIGSCAAHLDLLVTQSSSDDRGIRRWKPLLPCIGIYGWLSLLRGLKTADNLIKRNIRQILNFVADCVDIPAAIKPGFYLAIWTLIYYIWKEINGRKLGNHSCSLTSVEHVIRKAINLELIKWKRWQTFQLLLCKYFE
ncbi:hypothetical protein M5K25_014278 [Dendrobium thyrsiflorum]|uniref:Reverse transcriptase zinc-binding domain-containing protein n=1 Tax=Dendrobium thyrsiflorum TaxID=117978 RepID=A0ABD0UVA3_DENTH